MTKYLKEKDNKSKYIWTYKFSNFIFDEVHIKALHFRNKSYLATKRFIQKRKRSEMQFTGLTATIDDD